MATDYSKDFNFITDRLAIGSLASRSMPGFVAVVSVVTVEGRHRGRPWSAELTAKAPQVPGGVWVRKAWSDLSGNDEWFMGDGWELPTTEQTHPCHREGATVTTPILANGGVQVISVAASPGIRAYSVELAKRADRIRQGLVVFTEAYPSVELDCVGKYRTQTRLRFHNVPELLNLLSEAWDFVRET